MLALMDSPAPPDNCSWFSFDRFEKPDSGDISLHPDTSVTPEGDGSKRCDSRYMATTITMAKQSGQLPGGPE